MYNSIIQIYRDLLTITHGSYAQMLEKKRVPDLFRQGLMSMRHIISTLLDWCLYRGKEVIGNQEFTKEKVWLLIASQNNLHALKFLEESLSNSCLIRLYRKGPSNHDTPRLGIYLQMLYWYRIPALFVYLYSHYKVLLFRNFFEFLKAAGSYEAAIRILKKQNPSAIIFANDHIPELRAFIWAAKDLDIPTVYVQHASISSHFPALRFDLSLLEGRDSLQKYQAIDQISGRIELIGMPRFDPFLSQRNHSRTIKKIGVCSSLLDNGQRLTDLIACLTKDFKNYTISFRAHPREWRNFKFPKSVLISDPNNESIFEFLTNQDLMIGGDTSAHLEAVLLNITSIYYPLNDKQDDYYEYHKNGLVEKANDLESLINLITTFSIHRPEVFHKAKYYHEFVNTEKEGKSGELAVKLVKNFIKERALTRQKIR